MEKLDLAVAAMLAQKVFLVRSPPFSLAHYTH
jgi:hypothetical protein